MTMPVGWRLSGVDARRWRVRRASLWRPPVTVRRSVVEVPGRHGAVPSGRLPVFAEPTVSLVLQPLEAGDQDALEAAVNELTAILAAPTLSLTRVSGELEVSAAAQLVSISQDRFVAGTVARVTVVLAVPGVFFHEAPVTSLVASPVPSSLPLPHLGGSTAPVTGAVVRVRGPLTQATVTDPVSGTGLHWAGSLTSSQYLYLDAAGLSARRSSSSSAWESGGTTVSGGLDYPAAGPLALWPRVSDVDPAVRTVSLDVATVGAGTGTSIQVRAGRAFL